MTRIRIKGHGIRQEHRDRIVLRTGDDLDWGVWLSAVEEANQKWLEEGGIDLKRAVEARIDGESRPNMDREQVGQIVMEFMQNVIIRTAEKVHGYKRQRGETKWELCYVQKANVNHIKHSIRCVKRTSLKYYSISRILSDVHTLNRAYIAYSAMRTF